MSLRVVMVGLLLLTATALGLIAWQVSGPPRIVAGSGPMTEPVAPSPAMAAYLVAARSLPAGTLTRPEDFSVRSAQPGQVPPEAIIDAPGTRAEMRGALVKRFLENGATVQHGDVIRPRDRGFIAAVLPQGTRAASIAVDAVSGVAGLIWPGDRVDIILTQEFPPGSEHARRIVTSETIITDVRVIAVDQEITQGPPTSGNAGKLAATVTLEAANDQAEKLAVSAKLGKLSLAVRSAGDAERPVIIAPGGVSGVDVSPALAKAIGLHGPKIQVIQGDHRSEVNFK